MLIIRLFRIPVELLEIRAAILAWQELSRDVIRDEQDVVGTTLHYDVAIAAHTALYLVEKTGIPLWWFIPDEMMRERLYEGAEEHREYMAPPAEVDQPTFDENFCDA